MTNQHMDAMERAQAYGARMDEPLLLGDIQEMTHLVDQGVTVWLNDPQLAKIVRLRLIGFNSREYPRWDISYCYGQLKADSDYTLAEGKKYVRVLLPMRNPGRFWEKELVTWGRANNVYVKGLGIFDGDVVSKLYG